MNDDLESVGRALAILRSIRTLDQAEVARLAGVAASAVSEYESGKTVPSPRTLERILRGMDLTRADLAAAISLVRRVRSSGGAAPPALADAAERLGSTTGQLACSVAAHLFQATVRLGTETVDASQLWERLRRYGKRERQAVLRECPEFRSGALSRLLCAESVKAAADELEQAEDMAGLALEVASLLPGDPRRRSRARAYAWGFVANARRVRGDLAGADEAFARSAGAWKRETGEPGALTPAELRDAIRLLDLEASLRQAQGRAAQTLELIARAMALDGGESSGRLLILKANTLEMLDDFAGSVTALRQAAPHLEKDGDLRLLFCQRFNLVGSLALAGRLAEAVAILPDVQAMGASLGNQLDLLRLRWLEAKIDASLGNVPRSLAAFRQTRDAFVAHGLAYEAALITLQAATVAVDSGTPREVQRFAREAAPLIAISGLDPDIPATIEPFRHAAEAGRLTGPLAHHLFDTLWKRNAPA